jgi:hypothetical protein
MPEKAGSTPRLTRQTSYFLVSLNSNARGVFAEERAGLYPAFGDDHKRKVKSGELRPGSNPSDSPIARGWRDLSDDARVTSGGE